MERPGAPYRNIAALQWDDASTEPHRTPLDFRKSPTVAILGRGPRFHLRHFLRIRASELLAARSLCLAGGVPSLPGLSGYEPPPQDATPRSAFGSSPETAPQMSEDN